MTMHMGFVNLSTAVATYNRISSQVTEAKIRVAGSSPKCIRKKTSEVDSEESEKHYLVQ